MKKLILYLFLLLNIHETAYCQPSDDHFSINFDNTPLIDCINFIQDVSGKTIIVNWKELNSAGIFKDEPITLKVKQSTIYPVLDLLLTTASDNTTLVHYTDNGIIKVTTKELALTTSVTKIYNVQDLIHTIPNFTFQTTDLPSATAFPGQMYPLPVQPNDTHEKQDRVTSKIQELTVLIESTIEPEIWVDNGGTMGYISSFGGNLIIRAPELVQEQIIGR